LYSSSLSDLGVSTLPNDPTRPPPFRCRTLHHPLIPSPTPPLKHFPVTHGVCK
jgi:hypothetical protein